MKIKPPKDFAVPEGIQPGDYFKTLDEWKLLPSGEVELCELDGCDVKKDADDKTDKMSIPDRAAARMESMQSQNPNNPAPMAATY